MHEYSKNVIFEYLFEYSTFWIFILWKKKSKTSWIFKIFMNIHDIQVGMIPRCTFIYHAVWRITIKNRRSPLQPFPQGNFMCWKSTFAYPIQKFVCFQVPSLQRRVLFPAWLQYHWSPPSQLPAEQSCNSDERNQNTTVSCSEQANVSTGILHQNPSACLDEAISYGWGNFVIKFVWCKCMQSFPYKGYVRR